MVTKYGGSDADRIKEAEDAKERITAMDTKMDNFKQEIDDSAQKLTDDIDKRKDLSEKKKAKMKAEVEERRAQLERGAEKSRKRYRKLEVNVIRGGSGFKNRKRARGGISLPHVVMSVTLISRSEDTC